MPHRQLVLATLVLTPIVVGLLVVWFGLKAGLFQPSADITILAEEEVHWEWVFKSVNDEWNSDYYEDTYVEGDQPCGGFGLRPDQSRKVAEAWIQVAKAHEEQLEACQNRLRLATWEESPFASTEEKSGRYVPLGIYQAGERLGGSEDFVRPSSFHPINEVTPPGTAIAYFFHPSNKYCENCFETWYSAQDMTALKTRINDSALEAATIKPFSGSIDLAGLPQLRGATGVEIGMVLLTTNPEVTPTLGGWHTSAIYTLRNNNGPEPEGGVGTARREYQVVASQPAHRTTVSAGTPSITLTLDQPFDENDEGWLSSLRLYRCASLSILVDVTACPVDTKAENVPYTVAYSGKTITMTPRETLVAETHYYLATPFQATTPRNDYYTNFSLNFSINSDSSAATVKPEATLAHTSPSPSPSTSSLPPPSQPALSPSSASSITAPPPTLKTTPASTPVAPASSSPPPPASEKSPASSPTTTDRNQTVVSSVTVGEQSRAAAAPTPIVIPASQPSFTLRGKATPNTILILIIYSTPRTYSVTVNAAGEWELPLAARDFAEGTHRVVVKTETSSEQELAQFTIPSTTIGIGQLPTNSRAYLGVALLALLILVILAYFLVWHRRATRRTVNL